MTDFAGVVKAWDRADVEHIHPLRGMNETAYWQSGVYQAEQAAEWVPEGGTVMDFGCGEGRITIPLARLGYTVLAVDSSAVMLKRLADNLARSKKQLNVHLIRSAGVDLQMGGLDCVIARAVLIHHSHADVAWLVKSLTTTLKTGGHFVADWPAGVHHERTNWIDVTTWEPAHRQQVAEEAGLKLVADGNASVWEKLPAP